MSKAEIITFTIAMLAITNPIGKSCNIRQSDRRQVSPGEKKDSFCSRDSNPDYSHNRYVDRRSTSKGFWRLILPRLRLLEG